MAGGGSRHRLGSKGGGAVKADIYQIITGRFIEQLKKGTVPWQKPWLSVQKHGFSEALSRD
jgi:antirestriction protein ArdC